MNAKIVNLPEPDLVNAMITTLNNKRPTALTIEQAALILLERYNARDIGVCINAVFTRSEKFQRTIVPTLDNGYDGS
jgi:hypothetical protein